jgi:hypothetical protein
MVTMGALDLIDDRDHILTERGHKLLIEIGIDPDRLRATRRVFARCCMDWTCRRPHLAEALPAAITASLIELGWLTRTADRTLRVAPDYDQRLDHWLSSPDASVR